MKKLAAIAALSLVAVGAQAQTYNLSSVSITVPFGTSAVDSVDGGVATVTGTSVAATAAWTLTSNVNAYQIYSGDWSSSLGNNVNITKNSETCTEVAPSTACSNAYNALIGDWISGFDQNGTASPNAYNNIAQSGTQLIITHSQRFVGDPTSYFFNLPAVYTLTYDVVPVPAAAWLFGSAIGLMGWLRRRAQA